MTDATTEPVLELTRRITTPSSVSPQAQAAIAAGSAAVPQRLAEPEAFPPLDDADAWKARIAVTDEFIVLGFAGQDADATTEQIQVDGVDVFVITPSGADTGPDAPLYYDIHGGAFDRRRG